MATANATISDRIKETRIARGLNASELARLVGVTPAAVSNWENNAITPRRTALEILARVLGVTVEYLLTGRSERELVETHARQGDSVATIIQDARLRLARATGLPIDRIKLNLQFTTE
jgi:HTH-type transcriptional regulator, cell division transcriptional repressor